jgi:hypothetical protein
MFSSNFSLIIRNKIFKVKDNLDQKMGSNPYLLLQPMITNTYIPERDPYVSTYGLNALSLIEKEYNNINNRYSEE